MTTGSHGGLTLSLLGTGGVYLRDGGGVVLPPAGVTLLRPDLLAPRAMVR